MNGRPFYESLVGLSFLSFLLSLEMWRKVHWSIGVALLILMISGLHGFFFPTNYPIPTDAILIARGSGEVFYSLVILLLFASALLLRPRIFFQAALDCIFLCALIDSVLLIYGYFILKHHPPYAMLNNGTADASFIVCLLPLALERKRSAIPSAIIMVSAILLTKSNTAFAGIGIGLAFWLLTKIKLKDWIFIMWPLTAFMFGAAWFHLGDHFLGDSGRRFVWGGTWAFYREFANPWIGFGTGSFTVWGDAWQRASHFNDTKPFAIWVWLHNEPLEILFENGIVGLLSILTVFGFLLRRTFKRSIAFPIACTYAFTGLTEMPLRLWVTQMLGICLLAEAFKKDENVNCK